MVGRVSQKTSWIQRLVGEIFYRAMRGGAQVLAALPSRWILIFADAIGSLVYVVDARGRRVGRQNLAIVFGDRYSSRERKRIIRTSMRESARALAVVLHAAPLTAERVAKWVEVPAEVEGHFRQGELSPKGAIVVSAHLGNWEILLGLGCLLPRQAPAVPRRGERAPGHRPHARVRPRHRAAARASCAREARAR